MIFHSAAPASFKCISGTEKSMRGIYHDKGLICRTKASLASWSPCLTQSQRLACGALARQSATASRSGSTFQRQGTRQVRLKLDGRCGNTFCARGTKGALEGIASRTTRDVVGWRQPSSEASIFSCGALRGSRQTNNRIISGSTGGYLKYKPNRNTSTNAHANA